MFWLATSARAAIERCSMRSTPFLEGEAVPAHEDTWIVIPRVSRESATVYEHARLAIAFTLEHLGANGLPLLRAGDWNDGIDALGRREIGTSVWMGFFLANVLDGFVDLRADQGRRRRSPPRCETALAAQRKALEAGWMGDHYALDFADDGHEIGARNAMTTGWSAYSGACDDERALAAIEGGLKGIERPNRVLLLETPFYEHSQPYPGRIADYPPGVRENGGQYSHGATWIVDGFMRLAVSARGRGDRELAVRLGARAFEIYEKISPLKKTDPESLAIYGLIPIQQPADIYDGWGHGGRGGWSWYTGSAARMVSAAYALLGIEQRDGRIVVRDDLFEAEGRTEGPVAADRRIDLDARREALSVHTWEWADSAAIVRRGLTFVIKPAGNSRAVAAQRGFWQEAPTNYRGTAPAAFKRGFRACFWA